MKRLRNAIHALFAIFFMVAGGMMAFAFMKTDPNVVAGIAFLAMGFFFLLNIKVNELLDGDDE